MKLRLFALRDTRTNTVLPTYFPNKPEARKERDLRNGTNGLTFVITYGPDHRHYSRG